MNVETVALLQAARALWRRGKARCDATQCHNRIGHVNYETLRAARWQDGKRVSGAPATELACIDAALGMYTFGWVQQELQSQTWHMQCIHELALTCTNKPLFLRGSNVLYGSGCISI